MHYCIFEKILYFGDWSHLFGTFLFWKIKLRLVCKLSIEVLALTDIVPSLWQQVSSDSRPPMLMQLHNVVPTQLHNMVPSMFQNVAPAQFHNVASSTPVQENRLPQ